ncbi:MAG: 16S rRNA (cytosine(967)-C(5))-methyltransferase RsmB [Oscillospiraceae bacterium]|nr:16S rRNA (cytosine(967)-C(5))-methyltransferase RsmB [Oscillospiraceae bacterium]
MALSMPREAALKVLVKVENEGAYLNLALEEELNAAGMGGRDSALCSRLCLGVMRNRAFLDHIISKLSTVKLKKLSVYILNILRIGIYSLRFMDKIPAGATVNECVKLARRYGHSSSAAYVNAVLRKAAEGGDYLDGLKGDELLAVKYSMPLWLVKKWQREQPDAEKLFAAMNTEPPTYCRLNAAEVPEGFEATDISPYTLIWRGAGSVSASEAYKNGLVTIQDCASQLCVLALGINGGESVLDLCAAPGGKSVFAAYLGGKVTALDLHEHRTELINANAKRLGVNLKTSVGDALVHNPEFDCRFDRVLADVPCSGLGIIRRKPDIKWTKTEEDGSELAKIQQGILENAARYVRPGGRLVYSTCTISKAENEGIVKWFLKKQPDFTAVALGIKYAPEDTQLQLRPDIHPSDGFFIAAFERST